VAKVVTQSTIVGISASSLDSVDSFSLNWFSKAGQPTFISNLTTVGGILPETMIYIPATSASPKSIIFLGFSTPDAQNITQISLDDSHVIARWMYTVKLITNIAYDYSTQQIFVTAFDQNLQRDFLYELDSTSGQEIPLLDINGTVQVAMSTYCPIGHIFFVALINSNDLGYSIGKIDTQTKTMSRVAVNDTLEIILWDYTSAIMFALVADDDGSMLVTIDITSGNRTKIIAAFPKFSGTGGAATLDVKTKIVYASLLDISKNETPVWVLIDTTTGNNNVIPTDPNKGFPIGLAITA